MACDKAGYKSKADADKMLHRLWARVKPGRKLEARSYKCDCGRWHLTSQGVNRGC